MKKKMKLIVIKVGVSQPMLDAIDHQILMGFYNTRAAVIMDALWHLLVSFEGKLEVPKEKIQR